MRSIKRAEVSDGWKSWTVELIVELFRILDELGYPDSILVGVAKQ